MLHRLFPFPSYYFSFLDVSSFLIFLVIFFLARLILPPRPHVMYHGNCWRGRKVIFSFRLKKGKRFSIKGFDTSCSLYLFLIFKLLHYYFFTRLKMWVCSKVSIPGPKIGIPGIRKIYS